MILASSSLLLGDRACTCDCLGLVYAQYHLVNTGYHGCRKEVSVEGTWNLCGNPRIAVETKRRFASTTETRCRGETC